MNVPAPGEGQPPGGAPMPVGARIRWSLALYASVMTIYFAAGHAARPPWISLRTRLDDAIPFVPEAMPGYALAYVVPLALLFVATTPEGMRRMARACLLAYAMAAPFFVLLPVRDADPPVEGVTWAERALLWNRAADVTKNAFPSMHVGLAVLLGLVAWRHHRAWGVALFACAAVISASTLLVKQHFIVDLPAGALVAVAAFTVVYGREAAWRRTS